MGHAPTGQNGDPFLAFADDLRDGAPKLVGSMRLWQRRHVNINEERHDGNLPLLENVFKGHDEGVAHESLVAERHIEVTLETTVKESASQCLMHLHPILIAAERANDLRPDHHSKGRSHVERKRFKIIETKYNDDFRVRFVNDETEPGNGFY